MILSRTTPLAEGLAAFGVLIGLQYTVAWATTRFPAVETLVKSSPVLLYYKGNFDSQRLRRERLTVGEVRAAVRKAGLSSMDHVAAVVLESAGELSVLPLEDAPATALTGVVGRPEEGG